MHHESSAFGTVCRNMRGGDEQFCACGTPVLDFELYSVSWGSRLTLRELAGSHFLLLAGEEGERWCEAAREMSARLGVALAAHAIGHGTDLLDYSERLYDVLGVTRSGAVLVTPEGRVHWRATGLDADPERAVARALLRLQVVYGSAGEG